MRVWFIIAVMTGILWGLVLPAPSQSKPVRNFGPFKVWVDPDTGCQWLYHQPWSSLDSAFWAAPRMEGRGMTGDTAQTGCK